METLKWIAGWVGGLVVLFGLAVVVCPRLMTGVYTDVTIDRISSDKKGQYSIDLSEVASAGSNVVSGFYDGAKYNGGGSGGNSGFLGWPVHGTEGVIFTLDPEAAVEKRAPRLRDDRLLVHVGDKRRLRAGERLYFFDFTTDDGVRHYGFVEVEPWHDPPRMIRKF
jgi:hypothetical protein